VIAVQNMAQRMRMKLLISSRPAPAMAALVFLAASLCPAQQSLTWEQVKGRFESANPALKADALNVDETRAAETTAFLRPNPQFTFATDGTQIAPNNGVWQPLSGTQYQSTLSYLHERDRKRELRQESAEDATRIAAAQHEDFKRNLEFDLRAAFVGTLEAKAVLQLAQADLAYYDKIIEISRSRFKAGDIAQIDLDRIELLRVQYEVEIQTATVNLRTSKIQLLQMLDDHTPRGAVRRDRAVRVLRCAQAARRFSSDRSRRAP
jgi:cobalt-zinc-cadmium efflux system outer membrane protein